MDEKVIPRLNNRISISYYKHHIMFDAGVVRQAAIEVAYNPLYPSKQHCISVKLKQKSCLTDEQLNLEYNNTSIDP